MESVEDDVIYGAEYDRPVVKAFASDSLGFDPEEILRGMNAGVYKESDPAPFVKDATIGTFTNQHNTNINQMERGYKVVKLSELAKNLGLPSSKGYKTKDYLQLVIEKIEENGYRFVQFLQLVDVLYVITQQVPASTVSHVTLPPEEFRPEQEIAQHYGYGDEVLDSQLKESTKVQEREPVTEEPPELAGVKKRDHLKKSMKKKPLPWEK